MNRPPRHTRHTRAESMSRVSADGPSVGPSEGVARRPGPTGAGRQALCCPHRSPPLPASPPPLSFPRDISTSGITPRSVGVRDPGPTRRRPSGAASASLSDGMPASESAASPRTAHCIHAVHAGRSAAWNPRFHSIRPAGKSWRQRWSDSALGRRATHPPCRAPRRTLRYRRHPRRGPGGKHPPARPLAPPLASPSPKPRARARALPHTCTYTRAHTRRLIAYGTAAKRKRGLLPGASERKTQTKRASP